MQLKLNILPINNFQDAEVEMNAFFAGAPGAGREEGV